MRAEPSMGELNALGDAEFERLRALIRRETGLALGDAKRTLVQTRLARRLRALKLEGYGEYVQLLERSGGAGEELRHFIGALTTHTTHFWREAHHFELLERSIIAEARANGIRRLRLWSAASSTGEEPWCLAMTVAGTLGDELGDWDVRVLATDIDRNSLERAAAAVYEAEVLEQHPEMRRFFLKGVRAREGTVCLRPELRSLVTFRPMNLVEADWRPNSRFDAIFLRNVLIYFDAATQLRVVTELSSYLADGGVLVLGHAESMVGTRAGLKSVGRGAFKRGSDT